MDLGIWATWYDLEDANRDTFLNWAHSTYLPYLRSMGGVQWVAHYADEGGGPQMDHLVSNIIGRTEDDIGNGSQFVILVGAKTAHDFFDPHIPDIIWPDGFEPMLDMQVGRRSAILAEVHRIDGPDIDMATSDAPGPYIQMGSFCMKTLEKDFELGKWYAQHRFPYMAQMAGCIRTRKFAGVAGWAKHAVMYEFATAEARLEQFEIKHETHDQDQDAWHTKVLPFTSHSPGSPTIGPRIWPPV